MNVIVVGDTTAIGAGKTALTDTLIGPLEFKKERIEKIIRKEKNLLTFSPTVKDKKGCISDNMTRQYKMSNFFR